MAKLTDEEKKFWYQNFTLKGRILHPNLLEAKPSGNSGRLAFSTMFAWHESENQAEMAKINAFVAQAKAKYHPNIPDLYFSYPVKHFNTYVKQNGQPNPEYLRAHHWLNASSGVDMKPQLVDQQLKPVMSAAEVYSGRNAVISISFWNNTGGKDGTGKKGISVNVSAVMLMPGGEEIKGASDIDVNAVFGQFAKDMSHIMPAQPAPQQQYQAPQQQYQAPQQQYQAPPQQQQPQWPPQQNINPITGQPY